MKTLIITLAMIGICCGCDCEPVIRTLEFPQRSQIQERMKTIEIGSTVHVGIAVRSISERSARETRYSRTEWLNKVKIEDDKIEIIGVCRLYFGSRMQVLAKDVLNERVYVRYSESTDQPKLKNIYEPNLCKTDDEGFVDAELFLNSEEIYKEQIEEKRKQSENESRLIREIKKRKDREDDIKGKVIFMLNDG